MHTQAALALAAMAPSQVGDPINKQRLFDCVNVILSYQNPTGGWATYENTRSFAWLEVSPSELPVLDECPRLNQAQAAVNVMNLEMLHLSPKNRHSSCTSSHKTGQPIFVCDAVCEQPR